MAAELTGREWGGFCLSVSSEQILLISLSDVLGGHLTALLAIG